MASEDTPLFWTKTYWFRGERETTGNVVRIQKEGYILYLDLGDEEVNVPGRATFGGWWRESEPHKSGDFPELFNFLFTEFAGRRWTFKFPPTHFFPELFTSQLKHLIKMGGVPISEKNSTILKRNFDSFDITSQFSRGNRKRVRLFHERGGKVRRATPRDYKTAFSVLSESRARRGVALSMTWGEFQSALFQLPSSYQCWIASSGSDILGAALTVDISADALYVLYWGDTLTGREVSVSAALCEHLATFAWTQGKELLDLGVSSVDGQIDEGLLRFKRNLGASDFDQWTCRIQP